MTPVASRLLAWFDRHGRHDLPWQSPRTPYRTWVSEIMLQQTQVAAVIPYFNRFLSRFPTLPDLANASLDEVLALWSGLGYYRRAHNLHASAKAIMVNHDGELPGTFAELMALPGIGRTTAGAILAQAFDLPWPILDGNARRVLIRFHGVAGWHGQAAVQQRLWRHAEQHLPTQRAADYTQAIMDLGAGICTRQSPRCLSCPLADDCAAHRNGLTATLPQRQPRRPPPMRKTRMLVLRTPTARVWLQRRPAGGVWPQLWALPELGADESIEHALQREGIGAAVRGHTVMPTFVHTFSHFRLAITPCLVEVDTPPAAVADSGERGWFGPEQLASLGLPAPLRKLLDHINEEIP